MARVVVTFGANSVAVMPFIRPEACAKSTAALYQPLCASVKVLDTKTSSGMALSRSAVAASTASVVFAAL